MHKDKPHNRSFFIKIGQLDIKTLNESLILQDYFEIHVCCIIYNILNSSKLYIYDCLTNNSYSYLDVRYNYSEDRIMEAFYEAENVPVPFFLDFSLHSVTDTITKYLEQVIFEFYMSEFNKIGCLNINSILVNSDSLLITCEFLVRG